MRLLERVRFLFRRRSSNFTLDDPRPVAQLAPYTYFLPTPEETAALQPGDLVKLIFRGATTGSKWDAERMWVSVTEVGQEWSLGILENEPDDLPQVKFGDRVRFKKFHIVGIIPSQPQNFEVMPRRREFWERCMVEDCVLDGTKKVGYICRVQPAPLEGEERHKDSGWRIQGDRRNATHQELQSRKQVRVALGSGLNQDDSWLYLIDKPVGSAFVRDFDTESYFEE